MVICGLKFTGKLQRSMETFTFFFRFRQLEFLHSKNGNYNKCSQRVARCLFLVIHDPRSPAPSSSWRGVFYCPLKWKEISRESLVLTKASCPPASPTSPTQRALIWTHVWKILPPVCKHRNVWPCDIRGKRLEANI